jgi:hypothetical protein
VPVTGPEAARPRDLVHATLLAFGGPLVDPSETLSLLESMRDVRFGEVIFRYVDLVRYERQTASVRIVLLRRIALSAA